MGNHCTRWRPCVKGLSLDGGQADFSKKPPQCFLNRMSLFWAGSISLDSTFNVLSIRQNIYVVTKYILLKLFCLLFLFNDYTYLTCALDIVMNVVFRLIYRSKSPAIILI
jgi:hypothetical protein